MLKNLKENKHHNKGAGGLVCESSAGGRFQQISGRLKVPRTMQIMSHGRPRVRVKAGESCTEGGQGERWAVAQSLFPERPAELVPLPRLLPGSPAFIPPANSLKFPL